MGARGFHNARQENVHQKNRHESWRFFCTYDYAKLRHISFREFHKRFHHHRDTLHGAFLIVTALAALSVITYGLYSDSTIIKEVLKPVEVAQAAGESRYWVGEGSSANWNATGPTNWSATSGGANNASVPVSTDDVFFDANSPASTLSASITIKSLDMTGYTDTLTHNSSRTLTIAGNVYTLGGGVSSEFLWLAQAHASWALAGPA